MRQQSIGRKLAAAVTISVVVACLVTSVVSVRQEAREYLNSRREGLFAVGSAFASAIAEPLAEKDSGRVFAGLRGIGRIPHLVEATARNENGGVVATVGAGARLTADATFDGSAKPSLMRLLESRSISIVVPVLNAGKPVGRLELLSSADDLLSGLAGAIAATLPGALIALVAGLFVANGLQRSITKPLAALTGAMAEVQERRDYASSLPNSALYEVGVLVAGFNAMISEIKDRDGQLVRHRERLEQDIQERTQDLAVAKKAAEQANASKSIFLATMSHEIRTPLSGLLAMAELLVTIELPARARRYAEVISTSGSSLLAIINDILDFSKIEAGKLTLERCPVAIRETVDAITNLYYPRAREKGLDLACLVAPSTPATIWTDPTRLQQIVSNLVNNALKFTEKGHVLIEISVTDAQTLEISVADTGIGIPEEKIEEIFEAFAQAEDTTARRFGGTGLGLSISRRLTEAMGGRLSVRSTFGSGTTFICAFPLVETAQPPIGPTLARDGLTRALVSIEGEATRLAVTETLKRGEFFTQVSVDAGPASISDAFDLLILDSKALATVDGHRPDARIVALVEPGTTLSAKSGADFVLYLPFMAAEFTKLLSRIHQGETSSAPLSTPKRSEWPSYANARVLVADDAAVNREVMVEALARFAIVPDLVANGIEALAVLNQKSYDMVFMDGSMPEVDGFEATRRFRDAEQQEGRPHTPIIALTAHVVGSVADAWREAGMDGILHKPFTLAELNKHLSARLPLKEPPDRLETRSPFAPPAASDDYEALFDLATLDEVSSVDSGSAPGFMQKVLGLYRRHAPEAGNDVQKAAAANDLIALASAAHALKSMSLNIGARKVAQYAARIEAAARAGESCKPDLTTLDGLIRDTLAALPERHRVGMQ